MKHYSVLKKEALTALDLKPDGIYVDATLGYAGHASAILKKILNGKLYAFDKDEEAIAFSKKVLDEIGTNYEIIHSSFAKMQEELLKRGVKHVDGILFDLGVSSPQLDDPKRGFSFMKDEVLDMRMDQQSSVSAKEIVNNYSEQQLTEIFFRYGEESRSKAIAKKIVESRNEKKIVTTKELVSIIEKAVGANYFFKSHPERNVFQAIRIEVNEELKELESVLPVAIALLKKGGRLAVITFHSLEDRIVKQIFKEKSSINELVKGLPNIPEEYLPETKLITKKPLVPSEQELKENSRSKSAKLRVIERVKNHDEEKE